MHKTFSSKSRDSRQNPLWIQRDVWNGIRWLLLLSCLCLFVNNLMTSSVMFRATQSTLILKIASGFENWPLSIITIVVPLSDKSIGPSMYTFLFRTLFLSSEYKFTSYTITNNPVGLTSIYVFRQFHFLTVTEHSSNWLWARACHSMKVSCIRWLIIDYASAFD